MCLKYHTGSLQTQSNEANYHMLAKILKFFTTTMHCAHENQEKFIWVERRLKGRQKKVDNCFEICGANSREDFGATIK